MLDRNTRLNDFDPVDGRVSDQYRSCRKTMQVDLPQNMGRGYTDTFELSGDLLVRVSDATYLRDTCVGSHETRPLQIRIVLSGEIRSCVDPTSLRALGAMICIAGESRSGGLFISANQPYQSVVLECNLELLTQVIGLRSHEIPAPINQLMKPSYTNVNIGVRCAPECFRVAREILDSRLAVPQELRTQYIEYAAMSILCGVLIALTQKRRPVFAGSALKQRDLDRIWASRDYLVKHFTEPPKIPELAKLAGINQTKLKAGFREVTGKTIYDFILARRMERASELLLAGEHSVTEVAYIVGYRYPANFTCAFKKHYGHLPRSMRKRPAIEI
jgi:AraC-like DNA-binding protein